MNMETHNRYFRDIGYNVDSSVSWENRLKVGSIVSPVNKLQYENRILQQINSCKHVNALSELRTKIENQGLV